MTGIKRKSLLLAAIVTVIAVLVSGCAKTGAGESLLVFAGAASKPPAEEIGKLFEEKTGAKVELNFGGSGKMMADMQLAKEGDIYFPGSSDWMEKAKEEQLVFPDTEKRAVYLVSAINVQKGNPKNIKSLKDLLRPGVRVGIATPETVCVGAYAVEILQKNLTPAEIELFRRQNLANYPESCEKTANAVSLKAVDAVIGWSVFNKWDPQGIETIKLSPSELVRVGYIPLAVSKFTKNEELAKAFIDLVVSKEGIDIFKKHGYFISAAEAQAYAGAERPLPVGGWYKVPPEWLAR